MRFAKLHGLGNDFVLLDLRGVSHPRPPSAAVALSLCDRHHGIGADGVLTLLDGERMVIHNADGSIPEMCGNGARCAALWIATDRCTTTPAGRSEVLLQTDAGPRPCLVQADSPGSGLVEVEMGIAEIGVPRALPGGFVGVPVATGNPHRVIFTDGPRERLDDLATTAGPGLSRAEDANIEFVARAGAAHYLVAVWERGAGFTQACGTGACAVAAVALQRGDVEANREIAMELPGGALTIWRDAHTAQLRMRGPARLVYLGEVPE
jgi:diaminopimelate epimerase